VPAETPVTLVDGPCEGKPVKYGSPLPEVLVIAERNPIRYHDYVQMMHAHRYRHSTRCPCYDRQQVPVQLDAI